LWEVEGARVPCSVVGDANDSVRTK